MKQTVYIAGPLFSEAERKFNLELAQKIADAGFLVFLPQENSMDTSSHREKLDNSILFRKNVEGIDKSDLMVAVLDGGSDVDSGTAWEIGYAWAKGIPTIGLRTDFRTLGIEGMVNLMIEKALEELVTTIDDLVEVLERHK